MMEQVWRAIYDVPIIPLLTTNDPTRAVRVCQTLEASGIRTVEIALRTPAAIESIRRVVASTHLVVGAGTVRRPEQVAAATAVGARFLVTPAWDDRVVEEAQTNRVPIFPGVMTPTEVSRALDAGISTVKVFPVSAAGGPSYIRQLGGPFPELKVLASGGVTASDVSCYLALRQVFAVAGSWMFVQNPPVNDDLEQLSRTAREAVELATR